MENYINELYTDSNSGWLQMERVSGGGLCPGNDSCELQVENYSNGL